VMLCVSVHRSVLLCVVVCCSVLQRDATRERAPEAQSLECVAVWNMLR